MVQVISIGIGTTVIKFFYGGRDRAQFQILHGEAGTYSRGEGWSAKASGWKITKRQLLGGGRVLANRPNGILTEERRKVRAIKHHLGDGGR